LTLKGKKILALDRILETLPGWRYDSNHDIVCFEAEEPTFSLNQLCSAFEEPGLEPRGVGRYLPGCWRTEKRCSRPVRRKDLRFSGG